MISIYNVNHHYREIAKSIPEITFKILSRDLKAIELSKLVLRIEDPVFSKIVDYTLTEYCKSLYTLIEDMTKWAKKHRMVIK